MSGQSRCCTPPLFMGTDMNKSTNNNHNNNNNDDDNDNKNT